ncbi:hypothetical protein AVEN_203125-1 [Araneus ventricosus]|uniref:Uncharacterized protein n=1 Tax=Araneus ventricosus TaxID=182803 RepID=A0A4Y2DPV2_ARAVE|nr:hypothetical protein AVEN_203125-1 [Araneus ventricosus]
MSLKFRHILHRITLVLERGKSISDLSVLVRSDASTSTYGFAEKKCLWELCSADVTRVTSQSQESNQSPSEVMQISQCVVLLRRNAIGNYALRM